MRKLRAWLFLTLALTIGCGGRSELATSFQSETEGGAASTGGAPISAGRGGNTTTTGGGFVMGGAPGTAGTFVTAGAPGGGAAGAPGQMCTLPVSDCRAPDQVECQDHPLCLGTTLFFNQVTSLQNAHVVDVTTATDGRVAVAGYFEGHSLRSSNEASEYVSTLKPSVGNDAFVISFEPSGKVAWALGSGGDGDQHATGLDFSPTGDLIVQGKSDDRGFVIGVDADGVLRWTRSFDSLGELTPGQVAVDNDGVITLSGSFSERLLFEGSAVYTSGLSPYLLRLYGDGSLVTTQSVELESWSRVLFHRMVVDDEDRVILAGWGQRQEAFASFALKLEPNTGNVIYQRELSASFLRLNALTVDREMRVTFGGELEGKLELMGQQLESLPNQRNVFLAQLDREGEVRWLRRYEQPLVQVLALTVDGLGNLAMLGDTANALYVQKLRASGDPVWLREFPVSYLADLAIAADNDRNLWLTGAFAGPLALDQAPQKARGDIDGFVLKVGP